MDKKKLFHFMKIKNGENPVTKFIDNMKAVKVTMIDHPDPSRIAKVFVNFATGSWYPNYASKIKNEQIDEEVFNLLQGNTLGQGIEAAQFTFLIEGLSLHGTHALVRNRIGICYIQQSHAVKDLRHDDILVPRAYTKHPELLERYIKWCIEGKKLYSDFLDSGDTSVSDSRLSLPKTIPSHIYFSANLATIIQLVGKRLDSQEESNEMNLMAQGVVREIVKVFPYMKPFLKSACEKGTCLHLKKGYQANCIFKRDKHHEIPGYEDEFTLHDKTKDELSSGELFKERMYRGLTRVH